MSVLLAMIDPMYIPIGMTVVCIGSMVFVIVKNKFQKKGAEVIQKFSKQTISFEEALQSLKEGSRIRRKSERKGYTKLVIIEGKNRKEKFGTYWVSNPTDISDYCSFSIEDALAADWIIDE